MIPLPADIIRGALRHNRDSFKEFVSKLYHSVYDKNGVIDLLKNSLDLLEMAAVDEMPYDTDFQTAVKETMAILREALKEQPKTLADTLREKIADLPNGLKVSYYMDHLLRKE